MPTYLDRDLAGEYEQVWDELLALGAAVHEEPLYTDALAVARETMRRARFNVEVLVTRLRDSGYEFDEVQESADYPIERTAKPQLADLEKLAGSVSISLHVWNELVGAVSLSGMHLDWLVCGARDCSSSYQQKQAADGTWRNIEYSGKWHTETEPLEVWSVAEQFSYLEGGKKIGNSFWASKLLIASDRAARSGFSGGAMWITVPNYSIDALIEEPYPKGETFVQYLRRSFRWGGFPGFANVDEELRPTDWLAELTEGLLPI